jgi:CRP-like cAMP-binding protein
MTEATVYTIDVSKLEEAVNKDPMLYKDLLHETGRRLHTTLNGLENLTIRNTDGRIAHRLVYFGNIFGEQLKTGIRIPIPLTSQDIADILRIDEKEISKCLDALHDKHLIRKGKYIIIPDIDRLEEAAHS